MGLFASRNDGSSGWLAAWLCCCAASDDDASFVDVETPRSFATTQNTTFRHPPLRYSDLSAPNVHELPAPRNNDRRAERNPPRSPVRPSSLKPLRLGASSLFDRPRSHGRVASLPNPDVRGSISSPYDFRRLDQTVSQRSSLVPLRLGPVVLRDDPDPTVVQPVLQPPPRTYVPSAPFPSRASSPGLSLVDQPRESAESSRRHRETPFERCQARSQAYAASLSAQSDTSSLDRPRPRRKGSAQSLQSIRRPYAESGDIDADKEILELNTIVEERRAETRASTTASDVSPQVELLVDRESWPQSETLTDIGSAFSRPNTAQKERETLRPVSVVTSTHSHAHSRVRGWLSGMLTSTTSKASLPSTTTPSLRTETSFYKCRGVNVDHQRGYSGTTCCPSVTESDSLGAIRVPAPTASFNFYCEAEEDFEDHLGTDEGSWTRKTSSENPRGVGLAL